MVLTLSVPIPDKRQKAEIDSITMEAQASYKK